jgi:hypothetical protein
MATRLEKTLKRELSIDGHAYMLSIAPEGLKLTLKGRRKGMELAWKTLVSGEAGLAAALNASVDSLSTEEPASNESSTGEQDG